MNLIILGAGGFGQTIADVSEQSGEYEKIHFLDDNSTIHRTAYIGPKAVIGHGTVVLPHSVISTNCQIGKGCIINCNSTVDHGCIIEDGVHICLGAIVKAENRITKYTKIEAGEVVQARTFPVRR